MTSLSFERKIIKKIQKVVGPSSKKDPIALHEPSFHKTNAIKYLKDCIDTGWVSSAGGYVNKFESAICDFTQAKFCVCLVNGTVSIRLALHLLGVKPGDEVLLPAISFVATANAISHLGAIPHFIDIENKNIGLDPNALEIRLKKIAKREGNNLINKETGRRISAIIAVHVFGLPAEIKKIKNISLNWNLPLVEDCAEALGSWRSGLHCGLTGDVGTLSFNGNKILTTGGGGAIVTSNKTIAERAKHLSTTAKIQHPWEYNHDQVGWNDRMPNLNAAIGLAQMEILDETLNKKRKIFNSYQEVFDGFEEIKLIKEQKNTICNYWLVTLSLNFKSSNNVDLLKNRILSMAHEKGLLLRPLWKPLNQLPMYRSSPKGVLNISEDIEKRLINLPSSPKIIP